MQCFLWAAAPTAEGETNPKRVAPSTAPMGKLHTVDRTCIHALSLVSFQVTIRLWNQHAEQWDYSSVIYACELWIHQSKWRPLYANTRLSSIYFHWVYDLIAGGFIANILPDLSIGVKQEHELSCTYWSWSHLISVKPPTSPPVATRDSGSQRKSPRTASVPKPSANIYLCFLWDYQNHG